MTHIYKKVMLCLGAKDFSDELVKNWILTLLVSIIW